MQITAGPASPEPHVFRTLFCRLQRREFPVVALDDIVHWRMVVGALGLADLPLNQRRAYLPAGYFYDMHTTPPDPASIEAALTTAADQQAAVLYPGVRDDGDDRALRDSGFTPLPWFLEAEYHIRAGVDDDLRAQLGARHLRELRRRARNADDTFTAEVLSGEALRGRRGEIDAFARLHRLNLAKYGHRSLLFDTEAVEAILNSPLASQLHLFLRRPRAGGDPVQAILAFVDRDRGVLDTPVQGIDHDRVPRRHNLYSTGTYWLLRWCEDHGIGVCNLGRGAELAKLALGANHFHLLDNHLAAAGSTLEGLDTLSTAAHTRIRGILADLQAKAAHHDAGLLVPRVPQDPLVPQPSR